MAVAGGIALTADTLDRIFFLPKGNDPEKHHQKKKEVEGMASRKRTEMSVNILLYLQGETL